MSRPSRGCRGTAVSPGVWGAPSGWRSQEDHPSEYLEGTRYILVRDVRPPVLLLELPSE